jgi:hypothetical protein
MFNRLNHAAGLLLTRNRREVSCCSTYSPPHWISLNKKIAEVGLTRVPCVRITWLSSVSRGWLSLTALAVYWILDLYPESIVSILVIYHICGTVWFSPGNERVYHWHLALTHLNRRGGISCHTVDLVYQTWYTQVTLLINQSNYIAFKVVFVISIQPLAGNVVFVANIATGSTTKSTGCPKSFTLFSQFAYCATCKSPFVCQALRPRDPYRLHVILFVWP